ncbi:hypothetical protein PR048_031343 [Dryococelus australis]|uniref:Uncharacterized protein n=1 Tax=Dryococelus australis TaxID=614101 RepID=A0ABQ9G929_9NEOP|nr:hypothetical protein PR048_031343 [Dryococelus australis]
MVLSTEDLVKSRRRRRRAGPLKNRRQKKKRAHMSMEQRRNERAEENVDPLENPPTSGIVLHDSRMGNLGAIPLKIEPGFPRWEVSSLTTSFTAAPYHLRGVVCLELFCTFEAEKCGSDKGDSATLIKCAIATKRKALCCTGLVHQDEPGSIPGWVTGFLQVGIVPDSAVGRRVFSGISRFPRPFIPVPLHIHISNPHRLSRPRCKELPNSLLLLKKSVRVRTLLWEVSRFLSVSPVSPPPPHPVARTRFFSPGMSPAMGRRVSRRPFRAGIDKAIRETLVSASREPGRSSTPRSSDFTANSLYRRCTANKKKDDGADEVITTYYCNINISLFDLSPIISHVGTVPEDAANRRVFSGLSRFPPAAPYSPRFTLYRLIIVIPIIAHRIVGNIDVVCVGSGKNLCDWPLVAICGARSARERVWYSFGSSELQRETKGPARKGGSHPGSNYLECRAARAVIEWSSARALCRANFSHLPAITASNPFRAPPPFFSPQSFPPLLWSVFPIALLEVHLPLAQILLMSSGGDVVVQRRLPTWKTAAWIGIWTSGPETQ